MNFSLLNRTILFVIGGSRAYGLSTSSSDIDIKGVAVPTKEYFFGYLNNFEQADKPSCLANFIYLFSEQEKNIISNSKLEGSIYDIRKFTNLAAKCNPNILDVLFCRDQEIRLITEAGSLLRENRDAFLSKKARWTFGAYAAHQLKRIQLHRRYLLNPKNNEPTRAEFGLPKKIEVPKNQLDAVMSMIKKQIDDWEIDYLSLDESEKIYIEKQMSNYLHSLNIGTNEKFAAAARLIGLDENFIHLIQKEREYKLATTEWKQYQNWKKSRNPERASLEAKYGYDLKHAMHLVRLYRMCKEILEDGQVNVWRDDAEELMEIRNGGWSYERLIESVKNEDEKMDLLYKKSKLPKHPNYKNIDDLCVKIVESML